MKMCKLLINRIRLGAFATVLMFLGSPSVACGQLMNDLCGRSDIVAKVEVKGQGIGFKEQDGTRVITLKVIVRKLYKSAKFSKGPFDEGPGKAIEISAGKAASVSIIYPSDELDEDPWFLGVKELIIFGSSPGETSISTLDEWMGIIPFNKGIEKQLQGSLSAKQKS